MNPTWDKVLKLRAHAESAKAIGQPHEADAFFRKAAELEKQVPEAERTTPVEPRVRIYHHRPPDDIMDAIRRASERLKQKQAEEERARAAAEIKARMARARRHLEEEIASGCIRWRATETGRRWASVHEANESRGQRWVILRVVAAHGPIGAKRIYGATGIKLNNVRWHLNKLRKWDMVEDASGDEDAAEDTGN